MVAGLRDSVTIHTKTATETESCAERDLTRDLVMDASFFEGADELMSTRSHPSTLQLKSWRTCDGADEPLFKPSATDNGVHSRRLYGSCS
jgi:hypothetical protein